MFGMGVSLTTRCLSKGNLIDFTLGGCVSGSVSGFVSLQVNGNAKFIKDYAPDVQYR